MKSIYRRFWEKHLQKCIRGGCWRCTEWLEHRTWTRCGKSECNPIVFFADRLGALKESERFQMITFCLYLISSYQLSSFNRNVIIYRTFKGDIINGLENKNYFKRSFFLFLNEIRKAPSQINRETSVIWKPSFKSVKSCHIKWRFSKMSEYSNNQSNK